MDKGEHQRRTKSVLLSSTKLKGLSQRVQMLTQEVKQLWVDVDGLVRRAVGAEERSSF